MATTIASNIVVYRRTTVYKTTLSGAVYKTALLTPSEIDPAFGTNFIFLKKEDLSTAAANESPIVRQDSDPDGPPIGLPIRVRAPSRYEILGYTPAKFGEHPGGGR